MKGGGREKRRKKREGKGVEGMGSEKRKRRRVGSRRELKGGNWRAENGERKEGGER